MDLQVIFSDIMERPIYQAIKKETLEDILLSFYSCVHLPIQLLDENGVILLAYGGMNDYCKFIQQFLKPGETCAAFHQKAAANALRIGESYTFTCHSDLNHIVFPIVSDSMLLGSALVGPFLMESPDRDMMGAVANRYHMNTPEALTLYETASSIQILDPRMVNHLSHLLLHLFSNITREASDPLQNIRTRYRQQSEISSAIHNYKSGEATRDLHYPFDKEQLLVRKVRAGNAKEAKDILNDLLGYVLFTSGYSLIGAKTRSMELCTILSRTVVEAGADESVIMSQSSHFLQSLEKMHDLDTLCFHLQELTESFISQIFPDEARVDKDVIQSAISYMQQHFREDLKLNDIASYVYLNPAYFSTLFKQATGSTFKEYLTRIRIEEARQMLITTNTPIVDIALNCGFTSQSYFSKVFKAQTGFSPKSFRS